MVHLVMIKVGTENRLIINALTCELIPHLLCFLDHKNAEAQPHSIQKQSQNYHHVEYIAKTQGVNDKNSNIAMDRKRFKTVFLENVPK